MNQRTDAKAPPDIPEDAQCKLYPTDQSVFFRTTNGNETDCLLPEFDFELITSVEFQKRGVCLPDEKVAITLHDCFVGKLPTSFADGSGSTRREGQTFCFEECFVELGELDLFRPVLLGDGVSTPLSKFCFGSVSEFFDSVE